MLLGGCGLEFPEGHQTVEQASRNVETACRDNGTQRASARLASLNTSERLTFEGASFVGLVDLAFPREVAIPLSMLGVRELLGTSGGGTVVIVVPKDML